MLGSDFLSVRLGGIDALRYLAENHPKQYHIQAMRLLCAFVRNPTKDGGVRPNTGDPDEDPNLREDVQVALDAICACHEINVVGGNLTQFCLDFRHADLRGARFPIVDISTSIGPPLSGSLPSEQIKSLLNQADFTRARLHSAYMPFAKLMKANFTSADLPKANLAESNLSSANLTDANLSGASLRDANLSGASLYGVRGLTQDQLDEARADPNNPPRLSMSLDTETKKFLIWRGKPLDD